MKRVSYNVEIEFTGRGGKRETVQMQIRSATEGEAIMLAVQAMALCGIILSEQRIRCWKSNEPE